MKKKKDIVLDTLYKKAVGYTVEEVVEEYASEEKGGELLKKKITKKAVPPDIVALKTYIELMKENKEFDNMSIEELEKEKIRLIKQLKEDK